MKKIITFIVLFVTILGVILFVYLNKLPNTPPDTARETKTPARDTYYPPLDSGAVATTATNGQSSLKSGEKYVIPKEILLQEGKTTFSNSSFRELSGSENTSYSLTYLPYDKNLSQIEFNIWINKKPLSSSRLLAEEDLRKITKLPDEKLCLLDVFVWVPATVDENLTGQNLGLSFCPNSISLP